MKVSTQCTACNGNGMVRFNPHKRDGLTVYSYKPCPVCQGFGTILTDDVEGILSPDEY